jgi:hypothetical protein
MNKTVGIVINEYVTNIHGQSGPTYNIKEAGKEAVKLRAL